MTYRYVVVERFHAHPQVGMPAKQFRWRLLALAYAAFQNYLALAGGGFFYYTVEEADE